MTMSKEPYVQVDEDGEDLTVNWHYGPQGHPASMVITIYISPEKDMIPVMWCHGPRVTNSFKMDPDNRLDLNDLNSLISYGVKIHKEFGSDPFWHRCKVEKTDYHHLCEGCKVIRKTEEARTEQWVTDNPYPI